MARRTPGAHLEQFEAEHIIQGERRERRLLAQHPRS
jgi:hypothetical protein